MVARLRTVSFLPLHWFPRFAEPSSYCQWYPWIQTITWYVIYCHPFHNGIPYNGYMHVCMYVCTYVRTYVRTILSIHPPIHLSIYVSMYLCIYNPYSSIDGHPPMCIQSIFWLRACGRESALTKPMHWWRVKGSITASMNKNSWRHARDISSVPRRGTNRIAQQPLLSDKTMANNDSNVIAMLGDTSCYITSGCQAKAKQSWSDWWTTHEIWPE